MTSFTSPGQIFYLGFLFWHLWITHPPRACVNANAGYIKRNPSTIILHYHIYPHPTTLGQDMTQGQFSKRSLTGLNSEFSFSKTCCLTKAEEPSLSYYLRIAGGRIIGFIPFPRVLVLCEMQSVSSRIWTRVAVSISCDDNHYTTGTSIILHYHLESCQANHFFWIW